MTELAVKSLMLMISFWPIPLLLVVGLIFSVDLRFLRAYRSHSRYLLALSPLVPPLLMLWLAATVPPNSQISLRVIEFLFMGQILLGFWVVYIAKGYRWVTALIVAMEIYLGFFCLYVAATTINQV